MKNNDLAKKIKELRARKGMSQEELAQKSGLSLRTVQRIEGGETEPRGDTLQRIANTLGITPDDLFDWTEFEDTRFLVVLNLSAISFLAFPLLGILLPLALWTMKKEKVRLANDMGKRILNFQITWCVLLGLGVFLPVTLQIFHIDLPFRSVSVMNLGVAELLFILIPLILYALNILMILYNAFRANQSKQARYYPSISFLR
ncbi:helix-turn-helix domain-containing protein [Pedobacter sp. JY14-1]|uniref:helix-turn-helix domain-containing protein n=1 Tax=Pedobacter sp. JY14-1 TaxID=3034151 RepID=UPI0023E13922|nr:helix-turn-helix domain-containing protein [Pedobacter sp. JY14-1]